MDVGSDTEILAAVGTFIAGREAGEVLCTHYHCTIPFADDTLDALAGLLPFGQIAAVDLVKRLDLSDLAAVAILLAVLRKIRTDNAWIHYNLAKHLSRLLEAGLLDAKLPAIIHSQLAIKGLRHTAPNALPLPLNVLARSLAAFSPREAVRCGMLAARRGDGQGLRLAASAFVPLGLEAIAVRPAITQAHELARRFTLAPTTCRKLPASATPPACAQS